MKCRYSGCRENALNGYEYCILHLDYPKNEELVQSKVTEKIEKGDYNFECVKLTNLKLKDIWIKDNLNLKNSKIKRLEFENVTLSGDVCLDHANVDEVCLHDVTVLGDFLARGCRCLKIEFEDVTIQGDIILDSADVRLLRIGDFSLERDFILKDGKVKYLYIEDTTIDGDVIFRNSKANEFVLKDVLIKTDLILEQSRIENLHCKDVSIANDILLEGAEINFASFKDIRVSGSLNFKNLNKIDKIKFIDSYCSILRIDEKWIEEGEVFNDLESLENIVRNCRLTCEKFDEREDVDFYFYHEMKARQKIRLKKAKNDLKRFKLKGFVDLVSVIFEWLLIDLTCKYGTSWKRPLLIWLIGTVIFAMIYYSISRYYDIECIVGAKTFWEYLYFSTGIDTTLGFEKYHPNPNVTWQGIPICQALVGIEAVFGLLMWGIILTVLVRKYMR
jgi:hypothetical protein